MSRDGAMVVTGTREHRWHSHRARSRWPQRGTWRGREEGILTSNETRVTWPRRAMAPKLPNGVRFLAIHTHGSVNGNDPKLTPSDGTACGFSFPHDSFFQYDGQCGHIISLSTMANASFPHMVMEARNPAAGLCSRRMESGPEILGWEDPGPAAIVPAGD